MLKKYYSTEAEIPEAHKAFYVEKDGKWVLQVEGMVDADRVKEFRDENIRLKQELDKFKDVDPAKYAELKAKEKDFEDGKLVKKEGLDAAVAQRVAEKVAAADKAVAEAKAEADKAKAELERQRVSITIRDAGKKFGLRPGAEADLEARGLSVLKTIDGKLVACDPATGNPLYDTDTQPMSAEKWVEKLVKDAPHLFEPNSGAGARGGSPGNFTGPNPFAAKTFNLTEQAKLMKENPDAAKRLQAAAAAV